MEANSKSDVKAKEAYTKVLAEEGFKEIKIISTPTDISASKNGIKYFFELKFTNQTNKYFGAATLTEWECAINNLENFFFVICRFEKNKWLFDKFSPKEFIGYSTIPPFKIFFDVDLKNFDKKKSKETKSVKANFNNLNELVKIYDKLRKK